MRTQNPGPSHAARPGARPGGEPGGWQNWQPAPPGPTELGSRPQVFWVLVLGTVATMQLELPFRLAGFALCLPAVWLGVTILVRLGRARRQARPATRRAWPIGVGVGVCAVMLFGLAADAALYPIVAERERCVAEANTRVAMAQCTDQVDSRLRRLRSELNAPR